MSHRIEAAKSGRSTCVTCGEKIAKGDARVAELYQDSQRGPMRFEERRSSGGDYYRVSADDREAIHRYHHVPCAASHHPAVLASALRAPHDPALIADRAALDRQLADALEAERKQRVEAASARIGVPREPTVTDPRLEPLLARVAETPDDLEALAIIGDLLSEHGAPQGELISLQLALRELKAERAPDTPGRTLRGQQLAVRASRDRETVDPKRAQLLQRRDELMASLAPRLHSADRTSWGIGFVHRLELGDKSSGRLADLMNLWRHPTMRVLSELRLDLGASTDHAPTFRQLAVELPRSLRRLEIGGRESSEHVLAEVVAALPRLTHLVLISARGGDPSIAHPTLTDVGFEGDRNVLVTHGDAQADAIATLSLDALPAVRGVTVRDWHHRVDPLAALARTPWLARLDRIHIGPSSRTHERSSVTLETVAALRDALGDRKLARLELTGVAITLPVRAALAELCAELVCPAASVTLDAETTHVTHANKPEWGRGEIVKRNAGKLEIKFPGVGVKVFKADAPFLVPSGD